MDDLAGFRSYLARQGKGRGTIQTKVDLLSRLFKQASPLTDQSISDFLFRLYSQGRSAKYLNTYLDALRVYCRYKGIPYFKVDYYKEKETFKVLLNNEEIKSILELQPSTGGLKQARNWHVWTLFFSLCAYTGMRPGEVAKLTTSDFDFQQDTIIVRESKIGEFRVVPLSPKIKDDLYKYTRSLTQDKLFPSKQGGGLGVVDDVDWGYNFGVRLRRLGIYRKGLSVYSLRFSFITRMLSEDVNLFKVQRIVGHHRVEQTAHYTRYVIKDLSRAIEKDSLAKDGISTQILAGYIKEAVEAIVGADNRFQKSITDAPNRLTIDIAY